MVMRYANNVPAILRRYCTYQACVKLYNYSLLLQTDTKLLFSKPGSLPGPEGAVWGVHGAYVHCHAAPLSDFFSKFVRTHS